MVKNFFEMQTQLMKNFQQMYSVMEAGGENIYKDNFERFLKFQEETFGKMAEANPFMTDEGKKFQEEYYENFKNMSKSWANPFDYNKMAELYKVMPMNMMFDQFKNQFNQIDFTNLVDPQLKATMEKMFLSNEFYINMYDMYKEFTERMVDAVDFNRLSTLINQNTEMAFNAYVNALPDEMKIYFQGPKEVLNLFFDVMGRFFTPWIEDIDKLQDLLVLGSEERDPDKLIEALNVWKENYEKTFGKLLQAPMVGSNKEIVELQNKLFQELVDAIVISSEFSTNLMSIQKKATELMVERYFKLVEEGKEAKTFEEFYAFWAKNMDQGMISYFGSPEFSQLLGRFGQELMELQSAMNQLIEKAFESSPIVTEGKMDSMIKSVYDLKKEVTSLKKEVDALKEEKTEVKETKKTTKSDKK